MFLGSIRHREVDDFFPAIHLLQSMCNFFSILFNNYGSTVAACWQSAVTVFYLQRESTWYNRCVGYFYCFCWLPRMAVIAYFFSCFFHSWWTPLPLAFLFWPTCWPINIQLMHSIIYTGFQSTARKHVCSGWNPLSVRHLKGNTYANGHNCKWARASCPPQIESKSVRITEFRT